MPNLLLNIDVPDLRQAIEFYCSAFGLRVGRHLGSEVVELLGGPCALYLLQANAESPPFAGAVAKRSYTRHWTPIHLDFVVDDIDVACARALAAGALLEREIAAHEWGKLALFSDPFGHGFCLIQFSERGYDAIAVESNVECLAMKEPQ